MAINKLDTGAIQDNAITNAKMADDAVGVADLAATGTPSSTTFLRGDNAWVTPTDTDTVYTHPNHSGDVVSAADGAMTIQTDAVDIAMLSATGTAGSTTFLRGDNAWATAGSTSASDLTSGTLPDARFPSTLPAISGANLTGIDAATVSTTAPSSPAQGDLWFDSTSGTDTMKVYSGVGWDTMSNKFSAAGGTETTYTTGGVQYKVHTFLSSGTFTVDSAGSVEYLVIAGGGSGGGQHGGGGGAGGYRTAANFSIAASAYSITVGAGGAARAGSGNNTGNNGSNSVFSTITSIGGGGGEGWSAGSNNTAPSGGSGGGASLNANGGAGTSGQGNAGGSSINSSTFPNGGGGGGGSGSVGEASTSLSRAGNGGSGTASSISGGSVTRAGGGGGGSHSPHAIGTGGSGGGGNGGLGNTGVGIAATANSGSGGGGSGSAGAYSGAGGSGIVIIRYAI